MKVLLEEISADNAVACLQVSDASGSPVISHHDDTFESERCERLGGLISTLESSTQQALFEPEGMELEFEDKHLHIAKAQDFTIALVTSTTVKSEKVRQYVERVKNEIESQPESSWRADVKAEDPAETNETAIDESAETSQVVPKEITIHTSKAAANALSNLRNDTNDEDAEEDLIESLDISPKQKAILRIQQKALLDAKQRSLLALKEKNTAIKSLAEETQAKVESLNSELRSRRDFIDKKQKSRAEALEAKERAVAEHDRITSEIEAIEEAKVQSESKLAARLEQEKLKHRENLQKIDEEFSKKQEFAHSRVALSRKEAEQLNEQIKSLENDFKATEAALENFSDVLEAEIAESKKKSEEDLRNKESELTGNFENQRTELSSASKAELAELDEKSKMLHMDAQKADEGTCALREKIQSDEVAYDTSQKERLSKTESLKEELSNIQRVHDAEIEKVDAEFKESEQELLKRRQRQEDIIAEKELEEEELLLEFERRLNEIQEARSNAQNELEQVSKDQATFAEQAEKARQQATKNSESARVELQETIEKFELEQKAELKAIETLKSQLSEKQAEQANIDDKAREVRDQFEARKLGAENEVAMLEQKQRAELEEAQRSNSRELAKAEQEIHDRLSAKKKEAESKVGETKQNLRDKQAKLEKVRLEIGESLTRLKEEESLHIAAKESAAKGFESFEKRLNEESQNNFHKNNKQLDALHNKLSEHSNSQNKFIAEDDQAQAEIAELENMLSEIEEQGSAEISELETKLSEFQKAVEEAEAELSLMTDAIHSSLQPYLTDKPQSSKIETPKARNSENHQPAPHAKRSVKDSENVLSDVQKQRAQDDEDDIWGEEPQVKKPSVTSKRPKFTQTPFDSRNKIIKIPTKKRDETKPVPTPKEASKKEKSKSKKVTGSIFGIKKKAKKPEPKKDEDDIWD